MTKAGWWLLGAAVVMAGVAALVASPWPDALETFLAARGLEGTEAALVAPAPGYVAPGVGRPWLAGGLAGVAGVLVTLGALWGLGRVLRGRRAGPPEAPAGRGETPERRAGGGQA